MTLLSRHIRDKKPSDSIRRGGEGRGRDECPLSPDSLLPEPMRQRSWAGSQKKQDGKEGRERVHSLIVPIQLFPTSQRDIPFQRVLRGGRIRGKTVELAIRWGKGEKKKKKGKKRIVACKLSLLVFSFFFWRGEEIARKIFNVEN